MIRIKGGAVVIYPKFSSAIVIYNPEKAHAHK